MKRNGKKPNYDNLAKITHYLQTKGYKSAKYYKREAIELLKEEQLKLDAAFFETVPFPPTKNHKFTFIDLFAGIGGMRIAFRRLGGKCVFSSEWNEQARHTYWLNFGEVPFGDITKIDEKKDIPEHDILVAGFPCQAFSIAGRRRGFEDTRGTLFFDIARILKAKRPKAFLLENVKGLVNHRGGKTLKVILETLRNDLNYYVPDPQVLNAKNYGVPQNRERIIIVGFRKDQKVKEFHYPIKKKEQKVFANVKEEKPVSVKYYLSQQYLKTLRAHKARHESKGNGFGYDLIKDAECANAIVVGGMGRERNLVIDKRITDFIPVTHIKGEVNKEGIRKMTPREWARLQGFPEKFKIEVADVHAYNQFGNSVPVPLIQAVGKEMIGKIFK